MRREEEQKALEVELVKAKTHVEKVREKHRFRCDNDQFMNDVEGCMQLENCQTQAFGQKQWAYVERKVVQNAQNVYKFKIITMGNQYFDIGIERVNIIHLKTGFKDYIQECFWSLSTIDGTRNSSTTDSQIWTDHKFREEDVIQMEINEGQISYKVNNQDLGVCFTDPSLNGESLYAFVKISSGKSG